MNVRLLYMCDVRVIKISLSGIDLVPYSLMSMIVRYTLLYEPVVRHNSWGYGNKKKGFYMSIKWPRKKTMVGV